MSAATNTNSTEIQERSSQATRKLYQALGYTSLKPAELKYVALALAEVAADEVSTNPDFAKKLMDILNEVFPKKEKKEPRVTRARNSGKKQEPTTIPAQKTPKKKSPLDNLVPLKPIDMRTINPYASPDPYLLYDVFGREQLAIALGEFALSTLREMTNVVEDRNPNAPKPNKGKKETMIHFILETVSNTRAGSLA